MVNLRVKYEVVFNNTGFKDEFLSPYITAVIEKKYLILSNIGSSWDEQNNRGATYADVIPPSPPNHLVPLTTVCCILFFRFNANDAVIEVAALKGVNEECLESCKCP